MRPDELFWFLSAISIACGLLGLGYALVLVSKAISRWRFRRRMRNLPPPDDVRSRNLVSLADWKSKEQAAKRLRSAA